MGLICLMLQCDYSNWLLVNRLPNHVFCKQKIVKFFFPFANRPKNSSSTMKTV